MPPFGTFITHFQDILGAVSSPSGDFRDHFPIFPNISWQVVTFFRKFGEQIMGHQGHRLAVGRGGCLVLCLPVHLCRPSSCGACFRPCLRPVPSAKKPNKRPAIGFLSVWACSAWVGWFYMPVCVPCQDGDKGRKFSYLLLVLLPVPSVANFRTVERATTDNRTQKKKRPFIWSFLLGLWCVVSPVVVDSVNSI